MPVRYYMDVHVPYAITEQLRLRGVDVLTAQDDDAIELQDVNLLERARMMPRVVFTQDARFRAMAEQMIREHKPFAGLIFGPMIGVSIGEYVETLQLIAEATEMSEWENRVEYLPYR